MFVSAFDFVLCCCWQPTFCTTEGGQPAPRDSGPPARGTGEDNEDRAGPNPPRAGPTPRPDPHYPVPSPGPEARGPGGLGGPVDPRWYIISVVNRMPNSDRALGPAIDNHGFVTCVFPIRKRDPWNRSGSSISQKHCWHLSFCSSCSKMCSLEG